MVDLDIHSDLVPVSEYHDPLKVREEDYESLRDLQAHVDALSKYRQEMGRLFQALSNLRQRADEVELDLSQKRKSLISKYNLESISEGQWAVDFDKKQFVRLDSKSPVIP